jgi:hypothetical protein
MRMSLQLTTEQKLVIRHLLKLSQKEGSEESNRIAKRYILETVEKLGYDKSQIVEIIASFLIND